MDKFLIMLGMVFVVAILVDGIVRIIKASKQAKGSAGLSQQIDDLASG